jgi:hypothetical protein
VDCGVRRERKPNWRVAGLEWLIEGTALGERSRPGERKLEG